MIKRLGLVKTTLIDYPGKVASVLFTHGCQLRCPYCHNPNLVSGPVPDDFLPVETILDHLDRRRDVLGGVCITGGEPLVHPDLRELCAAIHKRGLSVKLDTNGAYPDRLSELITAGLVDYVAMDIKTAFDNYDRVGGDGKAAQRSLAVIQESTVDHEFRTTVAPGIVDQTDLLSIALLLKPEDRYILAQFVAGTTLDPAFGSVTPYQGDLLREWCRLLTERGLNCTVRGAT
jgi:pyruvate formate lyase activating enzyme